MPFINVKVNVPKSDELVESITKIVLDKTSNILNKKFEVTSVLVEFVSPSSWTVGEKTCSTFYFDIKITKGTNTKDQKQEYVKEVYKSFKDLLGNISNASYIVIDEIDADSWGFEGLTQESRYIKSK
jgi:4-oxalocrotonate tautomerase